MENYIKRKISIGISACQFGCKVRYNGKGWNMVNNLNREKNEFIWTPVCPEVTSGMGVPRPSIKLTGGNGHDFWEGKAKINDKSGRNKSEKIKEACLNCLTTLKNAEIDVFIYMEGSPSCGVYRTTLREKRLGKPPGIFGALLLKENIFLIPSVDLQSKVKWWDWRRRMYAYVWLKEQEFDKPKDVLESWHTIKFLIQELFRKEADLIGNKLSNLKKLNKDDLSSIKEKILNILRMPSDIKKIKQSLWKNYKFLEKHYGLKIEDVNGPTDIRGMNKLADELIKVEIISYKENKLFGSSPIYRKRKE